MGEETATLSLNQSQAIQRALVHNRALKAARLTVEQTKAKGKDVAKLQNPELNLDYAANPKFTKRNESAWEIGLVQKFPITQRLKILKNISSKELFLARTEILNQERLLIGQVETAVITLLHLEQQQTIKTALIELNQDFLTNLQSLFAKGEISSPLLRRIEMERMVLLERQQQLATEKLDKTVALQTLMGWEGNLTLQADQETRLPKPIPPLTPYSKENLFQHPEYQIKKILHEISQERYTLSQAQRWADIEVSLFYRRENEPSLSSESNHKTDFFGLGLSIPLPLRNRYQGTLEAAQFHQQQRLQERDLCAYHIQKHTQLLSAKTELNYQQAQVYRDQFIKLAKHNLDQAKRSYQLGQIDSIELYNAKVQWWNFQSTLLDKIKAFHTTYIDWKTATNKNRNDHML